MKIHEYQAAEILRASGVPVPDGVLLSEVQDIENAVEKLGFPLVLKAQVLVGGRGKAGGVKAVSSITEACEKYDQIKKMVIKGYPVEQILAVKALTIQKEFYIAVTVDPAQGDIVVIASAQGGVDIESVAEMNPQAIEKFYAQGQKQLPAEDLSVWVSRIFDSPKEAEQAIVIIQTLVKTLFENDASLVEVNPLVVDENGKLWAADAKINFDDNGLMWHPELLALRDLRYEDADELEAKDKQLSFVKLDGNVGCIVNGAGLAMGTMDVIKLRGGDPANFLDVGGSSNPEKVLNALKIILRNPKIRAILINIFGGITRCDDIAKGILQARSQMELPVPLVVRLVGTNEDEAKALLAENQVTTFSSMREAVDKVVALSRQNPEMSEG